MGADVLTARLGRLVAEADQVVQLLRDEPLTDADALHLARPAAHLAIVIDGLEELLIWQECLWQGFRGQPGYPPKPPDPPETETDRRYERWKTLREPLPEAA